MVKNYKSVLQFMCLTLVLFFYQNCSGPMHTKFAGVEQSSVLDTESIEIFSRTLQPTLRTNCAGCHGVSQQPQFAVADAATAFATIQKSDLVDFNDPAQSRFVQKIMGGHNNFPTTLAATIQQNITDWSTELGDSIKPAIELTSPATGVTISGAVILTATASDNVGVTSVQFYIDNQVYGAAITSAPYSISLNTMTLSNSTHTIAVRAFDSAGNYGDDNAVVTVNNAPVADTQNPTVVVTAPAAGATLSGSVNITANAADNIGVQRVEFYSGAQMIGVADTTAPYSVIYNTTAVANGSYNISARAYDVAGNVGVSANIAVTLNNIAPDTQSPTVSLTSPVAGSTVSGVININATAADNVGVTRVQFYVDGNVLGAADTTAPYSVTADTAGLSNGTHVYSARAYDAAGNMMASANVSVTVNNVVLNPNANYQWIHTNILVPRCISCHGTATAYAGVRYDTYAETMKTVRAGNTASSEFYTEVNSGSMPASGGRLSAVQVDAIRAWITAGALNN